MFHILERDGDLVWYDQNASETNDISEDSLEHKGVKYRSGRYPYGSGENPYQHDDTWLGRYRHSKYVEGKSDKEIALEQGISQAKLRKIRSNEEYAEREWLRTACISYKEKGYSNKAIAEKLSLAGESTVRSLLDDSIADKQKIQNATVNAIRDKVDHSKYVDVGSGTEAILGISNTKLQNALEQLQREGYQLKTIKVDQMGTGYKTPMQILIAPDISIKEVYENIDKIDIMGGVKSYDGGRTFVGIEPPTSVNSSRVYVRYSEDGGTDRDGTIELRRGVSDLSLGDSSYAQVRIMVDDSHYMKGMAFYSNDIPAGYDIVYNTNKKKGTPLMNDDPMGKSVLKPKKSDPDNPFGASIKAEDGVIVGQKHYISEDGTEKLSPINIIREEGDWDTWSKSLASQMLSKQPTETASRQLNLAAEYKRQEFDQIMSLEQPEIRYSMLMDFAEGCDVDAVELKGAALPRQSTKVLLPVPTLKDNEIYAPSYRNGEEVILIRYPHGGIFEIPRLRVNNKSKDGRDIVGPGASDAIGINPNVAAHLSGADFDGDTVLVIPTKNQKLESKDYLADLVGFDNKASYPYYEGMHVMTKREHGIEMGKITNLINDMTMMGATDEEIARAVRHSMVIVDAEKHKLNYKKSYEDNKINELYIKFRGGVNKGAATVVSQASAELHVPQRKQINPDPETGEKRYVETHDNYIFRETRADGTSTIVEKPKMTETTKMAEVKDAYKLAFGGSKETALDKEIPFAEYANTMKAMANSARKEALAIKKTSYDPEAYSKYKEEVSSLKAKYNDALKNSPYERKAQALANKWFQEKKRANPELNDKENADKRKKLKGQLLNEARNRVGAKRVPIDISDREWEAIMSGACSSSFLRDMFKYMDGEELRKRAMPKEAKNDISDSAKARIKSLRNAGYTLSEIADSLGISESTVSKYSKGG